MADHEEAVQQRLQAAAEAAVRSIGLGFDMVMDCRLEYCKSPVVGTRLIEIDDGKVRDLAVPGGVLVPNVPEIIKCGTGELVRFRSDVLPFQQMSEQFNQEISLSGKIPSGHFNAAFEFTGQWQKDVAYTKALAFDGVFITLYGIELEKSQIVLSDHVQSALPPSWDPYALAKFIEKYGTHIITGVKMGGKDVVYVKQHISSPLQFAEVQNNLKDVAEKRFSDASGESGSHLEKTYNEAMIERIEHGLTFMDSTTLSIYAHKEDITFFWRRKGGLNRRSIPHDKWCQSVKLEPEAISMSFIPISSLLSGVHGSGFLSHAINLYLRYKPPIELLHQFLDFQLPKQWAPVYGELALGLSRQQQRDACLRFSLLGPKLYVNTTLVDVGERPVSGVRLFLEGRRGNRLAIHLQHLSKSPNSFQIQNEVHYESSNSFDQRYHEKVRWKMFSHICTAPVESDDDLSVVIGAQLEVKKSGLKEVLHLLLHFSRVTGAVILKKPEWQGSSDVAEKSGILTSLASMFGSQKPAPKPSAADLNSALYPDGPPTQAATSQLLKLVDTKEMTRGPQDSPGFWLVSGARLVIDKGKISLSVKYSLLAMDLPDEEEDNLWHDCL